MSPAALSALVTRTARSVGPAPAPTDGALLTRFVQFRDEPAFAELVHRLGPMVLGVCQRLVRDTHRAEDAFQAVFIVLARRANDVHPPEAVRAWVHGVAVRTAQEARAVSARRLAREVPVAKVPDRVCEPIRIPDADALRALDEEVAALPVHLRAAVLLCELEGLSRKDAAERLAVPEGTLSSRLAKARKLLADRLRARGFTQPAIGLAALTHASVPTRLAAQTSAFADPSTLVPTSVAGLTKGVFRTMFLQRLMLTLCGTVLAVGALVACAFASSDPPPAEIPVIEGPWFPLVPAPPPELAAPIAYKDLMLVLVSKEGAAAVVFSEIDEQGTSLSYTFRYESADGKTTKSGKGSLFERRLPEGGFDEVGLRLSAGPIDLRWSKGGPDRGWVYYSPEAVTVHIAHADNFEGAVREFADQKTVQEKLDLKRFMRK